MFCTFISQYMLDVEFGIEKRGGYICICMYVKRTSYKLSNCEMVSMKRYMYVSIIRIGVC